MSDVRRALALVRKDMITERRSKAAFNAMAFFAAMVLFIFSFALGPDAPNMSAGAGQTLLQMFGHVISVTRTRRHGSYKSSRPQ